MRRTLSWIALFSLSVSPLLRAQDLWTGAADGAWTNASNWFSFSVPAPGADIYFGADAAGALATTLGADFAVHSVVVQSLTGAVSIAGNALTVGEGGLDLSGATANLTIGSLLSPAAPQAWNVATGRALTIGGAISGTGLVTKAGPGALALNGAITNGSFTIDGGTVTLNLGAGFQADALTINAGATVVNGTFHVFGNQRTRVHVNGGTLTQGVEYYLSNFEMTQGLVSGNDLRANPGGGTVTVHAASAPATITAALHIYTGGLYTFAVEDGAADPDLLYARTNGLGGAFGGGVTHVQKTGSGTMEISGAQPFTGSFYPRAGVTRIGAQDTLALATLDLTAGDLGSVSFAGGTNFSLGALAGARELGLTNAAGEGIILTVGAGNGSTTFGGSLVGPGVLRKAGSGTLTLTGTNTHAGGFILGAGILAVGNASALGAGPIVYAGGALRYEDPSFAPAGTRVIDLPYGAALGPGYALDQAFADKIRTDAAGVLAPGVSGTNDLDLSAFTNGASLGAAGVIITNTGAILPAAGAYRFGGGAGTLLVSSPLSGTNRVLVSRNGTAGGNVRLDNAANSFSGGIVIRDGSLQIDALAAAAGNAIVIGDELTGTNPATFLLNAPINSVFTNAVTVTTNGAGTVVIGGLQNYQSFAGPITLGRPTTLGGAVGDRYGYAGKISGAVGTLTIAGTPRVTLESSQNDFVGNVVINGGSILQLNTTNTIPDTADVTVNGTLYLNIGGGNRETIGALNGGGAVQLHPDVGGLQTLIIGSGDRSGTYSGAMGNGKGTFALVKIGAGTNRLQGAGTFAGGTTISNGTLQLRNNNALGTNGTVTLDDGGAGNQTALLLDADAGGWVFGRPIIVGSNNTGVATIGSGASGGQVITFTTNSPITMNRPTRLVSATTDRTTYQGVWSGPVGTLTIAGGRRTTTEAANTFVGTVAITGAGTILQIGASAVSSDCIPDANGVDVGAGALLYLNTQAERIDELTGAGRVQLNGVGASTLTLGAGDGSGIFTGEIATAITLVKAGSGTQVLAGVNTYTGPTTISNGTLAVNGSVAAGALTVAAAGTLAGTGTIGGTVAAAGVVSPGQSAGRLAIAGGYTQTGTLRIELGGTTAVSQYDVLAVAGTASLGGTLDVQTIGGFTPAPGHVFTVLTAAGTTGSFAATNLPALGAGLGWDVQYPGGSVVLSVTGAPPLSPYEQWAQQIPNPADRADLADPDGDGLVNLWEYSQGSDPTNAADRALVRIIFTNGLPHAAFNRVNAATDLVYEVQGADTPADASAWLGLATNLAGGWGSATNVVDGNTAAVHRVLVGDGGTNRGLRVKVTRP